MSIRILALFALIPALLRTFVAYATDPLLTRYTLNPFFFISIITELAFAHGA
jgi:hypothetical protein